MCDTKVLNAGLMPWGCSVALPLGGEENEGKPLSPGQGERPGEGAVCVTRKAATG